MVSRANMDGDIRVEADQVEAAIVVWLDISCSIVLSDDESILPVYVTMWPMVNKRLVPTCVHTYSHIHHVGSHWSADQSSGILAREATNGLRD